MSLSRDDSGSFIPAYTEAEIIKKDPFASIDQTGVGQLMKIAVEKGRSTRPDIKLGMCGEEEVNGPSKVVTRKSPDAILTAALRKPGRRFCYHARCRLPSIVNNGWPFSNGWPRLCPLRVRQCDFA